MRVDAAADARTGDCRNDRLPATRDEIESLLKLADQMGRRDPARGGIFIAMPLTRQELADLTGTTIETAIRIMSRWNKDDVLRTDKDGFVIVDIDALRTTAET